jgi:hypothetical protein
MDGEEGVPFRSKSRLLPPSPSPSLGVPGSFRSMSACLQADCASHARTGPIGVQIFPRLPALRQTARSACRWAGKVSLKVAPRPELGLAHDLPISTTL